MKRFVASAAKQLTAKGERSQILLEAFTYVTSTGGKQIRAQLIAAFNLWLNIPSDRIEIISKVVTMLHNASLLLAYVLVSHTPSREPLIPVFF